MYSVFRAEVPMDEDPRTKWNHELMKTLLDQDKVIFLITNYPPNEV